MAREIQPTPVLEGQDAIDFLIKLETYPQYLKEKGIVLSRNILNHFSKKKKKKVKTSNSENFTVLLLTDDHIIENWSFGD